jgi:hypothetical protein
VASISGCLVGVAVIAVTSRFLGPFGVGVGLLLINVPLLQRVVASEADPRIRRLLVVAFMAKLAATFVLFYGIDYGLYRGASDAPGYALVGRQLGNLYRHGHFYLTPPGNDIGGGTGTLTFRAIVGVVYALAGPSELSVYLVFSALSFWGVYLIYRAFRIAVPDGDNCRYAVLWLFLPSGLVWSSGLGKEAWMVLGVGIVVLGVARLLTVRRGAFLLVGLGLTACALVRIHVSLILFVALIPAYLARRTRGRSRWGPFPKLIGVASMIGIGIFLVSKFSSTFGVHGISVQSIQTVLNKSTENSAGGASGVTPNSPLSIGSMPAGVFRVLFRPLLFEAHNLQSLIAALEGTFLLCLLALSLQRVRTGLRRCLTDTYLLFCLTYTLAFTVVFASVANLGTLNRDRVQLYPFFLALLSLPAARSANPRPSRGRRGRPHRPWLADPRQLAKMPSRRDPPV